MIMVLVFQNLVHRFPRVASICILQHLTLVILCGKKNIHFMAPIDNFRYIKIQLDSEA